MARNKTETQLTLSVPDSLTTAQRKEVADRVIEFITDRTRHGYNVFGRDWAGKAGQYTKEYAKKKGVSEGGPVDLSLSFEMLDKMKFFSSKSPSGEITVGFQKGTKVEQKAEGNILGSYGRDPNPSKARPFLDILQKDLNEIVREVKNGS